MNPGNDNPFDTAKREYSQEYGPLANYLTQLVAIRHGLRQAIQLSLSPSELDRERGMLERVCGEHGLQLSVYDWQGTRKILIATRHPGPIDWSDADLEHRMGKLFGYPFCCVQAFASQRDQPHPLINQVRELVEPVDRLKFSMNMFLRTSPFGLFKHFPCSLACEQTRSDADRLFGHIQADNPLLAERILTFCCMPVLFTDVCGAGILFEGERDHDRIHYRFFHCQDRPDSVIDLATHNLPSDLHSYQDLRRALGRGDELALEPDGLEIRANGRHVVTLRRPSHLLWKILDFEALACRSGSDRMEQ